MNGVHCPAQVDNTTKEELFHQIAELQPCMRALVKLTTHKHNKFVVMQLEMVKAAFNLKRGQQVLADLGNDASSICGADPNRKAVLGVEKARKEVMAIKDSLKEWIATSAPTEELPGTVPAEDEEIDFSKLDLEVAFFKLPIDDMASNIYESELFTDCVSYISAQFMQLLEEGKVALGELARLGMEGTSWKRALSENPSKEEILDVSKMLMKVGGKVLREELEKYSKDSNINSRKSYNMYFEFIV